MIMYFNFIFNYISLFIILRIIKSDLLFVEKVKKQYKLRDIDAK